MIPSNHLILSCPLLLLRSIFPSIRVFSNESVLRIRWPKYWSFSLSIRPSNEYSGLLSFSIDWFDLLAVQGTLKSLLQNHGSIASILQRPDSFIVQLSNLSHSVVFLYFFALIAEEGFLISPCYSLELCIQMGISFLFSFASLHSYTKFQMKRERAINNKYEAKSCISDQPIPQY